MNIYISLSKWNGAFVSQQMVEALLVRYAKGGAAADEVDADSFSQAALLHAPLPYPASIAAAGRSIVRSVSSGSLARGK